MPHNWKSNALTQMIITAFYNEFANTSRCHMGLHFLDEHCSCNQTLTGFVNEYNRYIHSAHYSTHLINLIGFITQEIQITSKCELDWFID